MDAEPQGKMDKQITITYRIGSVRYGASGYIGSETRDKVPNVIIRIPFFLISECEASIKEILIAEDLTIKEYPQKKEGERKMTWQKCPICNGVGRVSGGYFLRGGDTLAWLTAHTNTDPCKICAGTGLVDEQTGLPPGKSGLQSEKESVI